MRHTWLLILGLFGLTFFGYAANGDLNVNGKLGVGTASPALGCAVVKDDGSGRSAYIGGAGYGVILGYTGANGFISGSDISLNVKPLVLQPAGGNIGIGTTSPQSTLDINGTLRIIGQVAPTGGVGLELAYGGGIAQILAFDRVTSIFKPVAYVGITHSFIKNTGETTMFINTVGNVGIGTTNPTSKLYVAGNFTATGTKNFEIDHPTRKGKKLVHACLEGPEAGVYYRGQGQLSKGQAVVTLPDYFEALTAKDNRTVQLTAQGATPFTLSCSAVKNGQFTVYGTKASGSFYWEVKAVRVDMGDFAAEKDAAVALPVAMELKGIPFKRAASSQPEQ